MPIINDFEFFLKTEVKKRASDDQFDYKMGMPLKLEKQHGQTCKLTALSIVLNSIAQKAEIPFPPPVNKNKIAPTSLRQLAKKQYGSVVGEIYSANTLVKIAADQGYKCSTIYTKENYNDYISQIISLVDANEAPIIFFDVDDLGNPTILCGIREHAVVVAGYFTCQNDEKALIYAQWGRLYWSKASEIFSSTNQLSPSRTAEVFYKYSKWVDVDSFLLYRPEWLSEKPSEVREAYPLPFNDEGLKNKILNIHNNIKPNTPSLPIFSEDLEYIALKETLIQKTQEYSNEMSSILDVNHYPALLKEIEKNDLQNLIHALQIMLDNCSDTIQFKAEFIALCEQRAINNADGLLSLNRMPQSSANLLCYKIISLFWKPKTLADYLQILLPGERSCVRLVIKEEYNKKKLTLTEERLQEYFNEPISEDAIPKQLKNIVISSNQLLDLEKEKIDRLDFNNYNMLDQELVSYYSDLARALYTHNNELFVLKYRLTIFQRANYTLANLLNQWIELLRMEGINRADEEYRNAGTQKILGALKKDADLFFEEQDLALVFSGGITLKEVINFLKEGSCDKIRSLLEDICSNDANHPILFTLNNLTAVQNKKIKKYYPNVLLTESETMDKLPSSSFQESGYFFNELQRKAFDEAIIKNSNQFGGWRRIISFAQQSKRKWLAQKAAASFVDEIRSKLEQVPYLNSSSNIKMIPPLLDIVHDASLLEEILASCDEDTIVQLFASPDLKKSTYNSMPAIHWAVLYPQSLTLIFAYVKDEKNRLKLINYQNTQQQYTTLHYAASQDCAESLAILLSSIAVKSRPGAMKKSTRADESVLDIAIKNTDSKQQLKTIKSLLSEDELLQLMRLSYRKNFDLLYNVEFLGLMLPEKHELDQGYRESLSNLLARFIYAQATKNIEEAEKVATRLIEMSKENGGLEFLTQEIEVGLYRITPLCCIVLYPDQLEAVLSPYNEDQWVEALSLPKSQSNKKNCWFIPAIHYLALQPASLEVLFKQVKTKKNRNFLVNLQSMSGLTTLQYAVLYASEQSMELLLSRQDEESRIISLLASFTSLKSVLWLGRKKLEHLKTIKELFDSNKWSNLLKAGVEEGPLLKNLAILQITMAKYSFPEEQAKQIRPLLTAKQQNDMSSLKLYGEYEEPLSGWIYVLLFAAIKNNQDMIDKALSEIILEIEKANDSSTRFELLHQKRFIGFYKASLFYFLAPYAKALRQILQLFTQEEIKKLLNSSCIFRGEQKATLNLPAIHYLTRYPDSLNMIFELVTDQKTRISLITKSINRITTLGYAAKNGFTSSLQILLSAIDKQYLFGYLEHNDLLEFARNDLQALQIIQGLLSMDEFIRLTQSCDSRSTLKLFASLPFIEVIATLPNKIGQQLVSNSLKDFDCSFINNAQSFEPILKAIPRLLDFIWDSSLKDNERIKYKISYLVMNNIKEYQDKYPFIFLSVVLEKLYQNDEVTSLFQSTGTTLCAFLSSCMKDPTNRAHIEAYKMVILRVISNNEEYLKQITDCCTLFLACLAWSANASEFLKKTKTTMGDLIHRFKEDQNELADLLSYNMNYYEDDGYLNYARIKEILELLSPANRINRIKQKDLNGCNLLHKVGYNEEIFDLLLSYLPSNTALLSIIMAKDDGGHNVMFCASISRGMVTKLFQRLSLIEQQALMLQTDQSGNTLLHALANKQYRFINILSCLTETTRYIALTQPNKAGDTPLLLIAKKDAEFLDSVLSLIPKNLHLKLILWRDSKNQTIRQNLLANGNVQETSSKYKNLSTLFSHSKGKRSYEHENGDNSNKMAKLAPSDDELMSEDQALKPLY